MLDNDDQGLKDLPSATQSDNNRNEWARPHAFVPSHHNRIFDIEFLFSWELGDRIQHISLIHHTCEVDHSLLFILGTGGTELRTPC
jgi:hypothetical protein